MSDTKDWQDLPQTDPTTWESASARELAEFRASFDLYDSCMRRAGHIYRERHPDFPENAWPDGAMSIVALVEELDRLRASTGERIYACDDCGRLRSRDEGGTVFTVCDDCWDLRTKNGLTGWRVGVPARPLHPQDGGEE